MKINRFQRELRLHRRLFREDKTEIAEDNMRTLLWTSLAALCIFLVVSMITPILYKNWKLSGVYYLSMAVFLIFICYSAYMVKNKQYNVKIVNISCGLFYMVSMFMMILVDTIPYPSGDAIYFQIVIVVLPTLFTFRYYVYVLFSVMSEAIFICCVIHLKNPTQWNGDVFVSIVGMLFSFAVAWIVLRIRTKDKDDKLMLKKLSTTDNLTGVYNKVYSEETAQLMFCDFRNNPIGALLVIDIDEFKNINDTCGHHIGDMALVAFADVLKNVFSEADLIGRIGGDEFVVVVQSTQDHEEILRKCTRLNEEVRKIDIEECIPMTCSIGVVLCDEKMTSYAQVFKVSDQALYQAKNDGKDRYVIG